MLIPGGNRASIIDNAFIRFKLIKSILLLIVVSVNNMPHIDNNDAVRAGNLKTMAT